MNTGFPTLEYTQVLNIACQWPVNIILDDFGTSQYDRVQLFICYTRALLNIVKYRWIWSTDEYEVKMNMKYRWIWSTDEYEVQMNTKYRWIWSTDEYEVQMNMKYRWICI